MDPVVHTSQGSVRGRREEGGIASFKGIPHAAPPVGPLRFRPPQPATPWNGIRDAGGYGPTAPKAPYAAPFDQLIPEVDKPGDDYLNLNIWTPDTTGSRPVMVFIHGGAFANGSGSVPGYDGTRFARDGVVLVTLNYRLGADGFLYLGDGISNLGLLDQISALEWVRDNIAAFGGDPGTVTVFGESAGAMSIGALLAAPRATGLFRRAILQSGAAHHTLAPATAQLIGKRLAEVLDVPPTRAAIAEAPAQALLQAQQQLRAAISAEPDPARWGEAALNLMPFEPVVDGDIIPTPPIDAITAGAGADVDVLVGTNTDEFRLFLVPPGALDLIPEQALHASAAAYGLEPDSHALLSVYRAEHPDAGPGDLLAAIATDWFYRIPAIRLAEAHARHAAGATHLYEFAWQPPTYNGRLGACHAIELPFVFDNLHNLHDQGFTGLIGTEPPQQLADTMHAAWTAFATTGDPGWPGYEPHHRTTMHFDTTSQVVHDPHSERRELWQGRR
ncbi:carboxylesterase/lipase family protein [Streptomyces sp. NPDC014864]|uniref:carboxylesterase/lipase family protein n=1 Tax=Streptomyces sp. NPDC014864 TaxID=3364924 RepID=UPI003701E0D8